MACLYRKRGQIMADLAHRHLAVGAGTVWFCFYYYRRSVVRAIYHRRWQILGKVLGLKNVFCHCSAPNLVRLSGLSVHGALSRIHTIISYLLWLKNKQPNPFYVILNVINLPEFQNMVWEVLSFQVADCC